MKALKKILITCTTVALLLGSTLSASAAELKDIFDATFYAENNPDVVAEYGNDVNALFKHYTTYGIKEGRNGGGEFDAVSYANRYPDVYEAYGYDIKALYTHYQVFGSKENRDSLSQTVSDILEAQASDNSEESYSAAVQNSLNLISQAEVAWNEYHIACNENPEDVDALVPYVNAYNAIIDQLMDSIDALKEAEMHDIVSPAMGAAYDRNGDGFLSYLAFG